MDQWLPRGYTVDDKTKIKRILSAGEGWQIYLAGNETYALAVTADLYQHWIDEECLSEKIFKRSENSRFIFGGLENHLISSVKNGPFPKSNKQIDTFSLAFGACAKRWPNADFQNAIFIEEYSLLLPTKFDVQDSDRAMAYGCWITGGVHIPVTSIERITQIVSWMNKDFLYGAIETAGFNVEGHNNGASFLQVSTENNNIQNTNESVVNGKNFSLVGRPELEKFINENIVDIIEHREEYARMGIDFPGATILHGPPGCGKTYAVDRLCDFLGWQRFDVDSSTIASSYIHDTSKKIFEVFDAAIKAAPSVIVIDEMEAFLSDRNTGTAGSHHVEEVAEFLRRIPEAVQNGVLIFAMTNMIESIDPAILRRGRFDHIVEVKMAETEELVSFFEEKLSKLPTEDDISADFLAEKLDKHPFSDITFVLREAGRIAVKRKLSKIDKACFDEALNSLPSGNNEKRIGF